MRELFRSLPLVLLVLAVPIVPFLFFGGSIEEWFTRLQKDPPNPLAAAGLIFGLLASDVLLPIPSSMVMTFGGGQLGWLAGTATSFAGMSVGAVLGFALARWLGPTFTHWFTKPDALAKMRHLSDRYGPGVIALTRGIPVLAEASVLLLGLERLPWRRFLPPLLISNLALALAYSAFGDFARQYQSTGLALGVSIVLPVVVAAVVQWRMGRGEVEGRG
jgi:membrane protein DedA with SNARE-associated domain